MYLIEILAMCISKTLEAVKVISSHLDFSEIKVQGHFLSSPCMCSIFDVLFQDSSEIKTKIKNSERIVVPVVLNHFNQDYLIEIHKDIALTLNSINNHQSFFLENYSITKHQIFLHTNHSPDLSDPLLLSVLDTNFSDYLYKLDLDPNFLKLEAPEVFIPLDLFSNDITMILSNLKNKTSSLINIEEITEFFY